jgi:8-hydroxy-5-deazaflavin:NADPH oxidoreductase
MNVAIIGAGNVGSALAAAAVKQGHTVTISADHPEHAADVAAQVGAASAGSNAEAAREADVVILAVPYGAAGTIVDEIADVADGKVIIDSTNPLNATYSDLETSGTSAAEQLQQRAGGAHVVKAFNTVLASRHHNPTESGVPLDAFYAGDDAAAKATVAELAQSLGYRPIDAGNLRMARSLEEMAFLNITLNAGNNWPWQSAWKLMGPTD